MFSHFPSYCEQTLTVNHGLFALAKISTNFTISKWWHWYEL